MSQEKVNRYKEEKANRKKNVAKEKRNKKISTFVGVLISLIIVGYLGVSLYATLTEDARQEAEYSRLLEEYYATMSTNQTTTGSQTTTAAGETTTTASGETSASETTTAASETTSAEETTTAAQN